MARSPIPSDLPPPPAGLELSNVWNKTVTQAVEWLKEPPIEIEVTERFLKVSTDEDELPCRIVAAKRMYSTADLYRFIMTRPTHTKMKGHKFPKRTAS